MDHQIIASLNELSQKVKERKNYEDRISRLEKKRSQTAFHAKGVHVEEKPAHQAQDILDSSLKKTESSIKAIKVLVWIAAVAAIILSGIGIVTQLMQGDKQMLAMFVASFVAAGISAFCFRRISNGDGGYYGAINYVLGWTTLSLNPGSHSVVVVIHSQGYNFRSAPQSFYLEGGSEVTLKFKLLGYNNIICTRS